MEVFGIGLPELIVIMVVILLIFGPDQLPEIAKKLGGTVRDLRRSLNDINNEVNEIKRPIQEIKDIASFAPTDTNVPSNLIVADDADLPQPAASQGGSAPSEPTAETAPPPEPPANQDDSNSSDRDPSTPM